VVQPASRCAITATSQTRSSDSLLPPLSLASGRVTATLCTSPTAPLIADMSWPAGGVGRRAHTVAVLGAGERSTHLHRREERRSDRLEGNVSTKWSWVVHCMQLSSRHLKACSSSTHTKAAHFKLIAAAASVQHRTPEVGLQPAPLTLHMLRRGSHRRGAVEQMGVQASVVARRAISLDALALPISPAACCSTGTQMPHRHGAMWDANRHRCSWCLRVQLPGELGGDWGQE